MAGPIYNPGEPYMLQIPGGFSPGRIAHITGTFKPTATSFILKFQSGPIGDPTDEIGLCMYGRVVEGIIGCNSFTRASGWGQEEAKNSIAFARGQNFDVTILCDPMCFKIALNGQHFAEYNHRTNPATLTCLNVASTSQDLTLACVWIEDGAPVQPPVQVPYSQASTPTPYPPAPNYGPPPPYSGGPGFAPAYSDQSMYQHGAPPGQYGAQQYPQHGSGTGSNKGLIGMVTGAGAAVAGALGASHLLGKSKSSHGNAYGGYPSHGGYPNHGGYPGHGSGGGGGILGKAMQVGGALATAKMVSKPSKALKYGAPLAGLGALGAGGYMMHKGMGHGFHCGGSSSSGSSEEE